MFSSVFKLKPPKLKVSLLDRKKLSVKRQSTVDLGVDSDDETDDQVVVNTDVASNNARDKPIVTKNLCKMIADERWFDIQDLLTKPKDDIEIIDEDGSVTRELIIHHACSHGAPMLVLQVLSSSEYWKSLYRVDKDGRFPIHVAALNGADPEVMCFLINSNSASTGIKDTLGKTPLHYVCEEYLEIHDGVNSNLKQMDLYLNVGLLLKAAPSSVNVEDDEEMNPIEYAIASGAREHIIKEMQRASRLCWRARKKSEGWKRHAEYAQFLQEQSSLSLSRDSKHVSFSNSAA